MSEALNETYNIGADTPYTILQLAEYVKSLGPAVPVKLPDTEIRHKLPKGWEL